jgi:hypothetical protein
MGHDADEFETRLSRCERALFGDDDSSQGLSARMHMTETMLAKIDATLSKLAWLVIAAVLVGILNLVIGKPGATAPHQSTSVITGDAQSGPALLDAAASPDARTWLTTKDVAKRIGPDGVDERTVLNYIEAEMFDPMPVKIGKAWHFSESFRILPKPSASFGTVAAKATAQPDDCGTQPQ